MFHEIYEEEKRINIRIGELMAEIKINEEKYGKELAEECNKFRRELIEELEEKLDILVNAEMIMLGIDYKKYPRRGDK